ncbi:MAG: hypothetical protein WDA59_03995 [Methanofastidiosum sp.]
MGSKVLPLEPPINELPCGCNSQYECSVAIKLWGEVNRIYNEKPVDWDAYSEAINKYKEHKYNGTDHDICL